MWILYKLRKVRESFLFDIQEQTIQHTRNKNKYLNHSLDDHHYWNPPTHIQAWKKRKYYISMQYFDNEDIFQSEAQ